MSVSYDPKLACQVGIEAATIYNELLAYWQRCAEMSVIDGFTFVKIPYRTFRKMFDFLDELEYMNAIYKLTHEEMICYFVFNDHIFCHILYDYYGEEE